MRRFVARLRGPKVWTVFPTRRLAGVVAAASVLWLLPSGVARPASIGAFLLIAVAAAWDFVRLPRSADIEVARSVPDRMGLGDDYAVRYDIRSAWPNTVKAHLYDDIPFGLAATIDDAPFELGGGIDHARDVHMVGERRGRFELGTVALRVVAPWGLVAKIAQYPLSNSTVVVPSLSNVRRLRLLALQHRLNEVGVRALKQRGEGTSFTGLRDYVPGDDPRLLDWKATARHARLITREQTIERAQTVLMLVDCGRAMTQLAGKYARLEHVLSAALVLGDIASTSGDRVGLIAFDHEVRALVPPQKGAAALRGLRTSLSALDATMTEPDYASAFRLLAVRQRRRALVVLFTDVIDVRVARSFIAYAGRAAQRHMLVVVAIQNEELLAAARPASIGTAALYRSAAAEELIREREEALARMRQAGITVLDVAAGRMAVAVVNRYLEIKSRGLL